MDIINKIIFIYLFVDVLNGTLISDSIKLKSINGSRGDFFGSSVAMNNDFIVIGTFKDDVNGKRNMGSVTVFSRNGTDYKFKQKIIPDDGEAWDYFGFSVALNNKFLIVGSMQDDTDGSQGSAYFYQYKESGWSFQQKVVAEKVASCVQFGISIAIDDNIAVIGSGSGHGKGNEIGTCHVFYYNGTKWIEKQRLLTKDNTYDHTYGTSVAIRNNFIVLGVSYLTVDKTHNAGMVYLYKRNISNLWTQHTILNSTKPVENGWFGRSVSMDHNRLVIGAEGEDSGKGNVYVYISNDDVWTLETKLKATDRNHSHHFGFAVSIDKNTIVIGAFKFKYNHKGFITGVPYVFKLIDGKWIEDSMLLATGGNGYDLFGRSLVVCNGTVVVGIYSKGVKNGSAYLFNISPESVMNNHTKRLSIHKILKTKTGLIPSKEIQVKKRKDNSTVLVATIVPSLLVVIVIVIVYKIKRNMSRRPSERDDFEGVGSIGISADDVSLIANTQA